MAVMLGCIGAGDYRWTEEDKAVIANDLKKRMNEKFGTK